MDYLNPAQRSAFQKATGFAVLLRGEEWLPLRRDIENIIRSKLTGVEWIPKQAVAQLLAIPEEWGTNPVYNLVPIPFPTTLGDGRPVPDLPKWLDTGEKRIWWDNFTEQIRSGERAFNQRQWIIGQQLVRQAEMNANLWKTAHQIAAFFDAPREFFEEKAKSLALPLFVAGSLVLFFIGRSYGVIPAPTARKLQSNPRRKRKNRK